MLKKKTFFYFAKLAQQTRIHIQSFNIKNEPLHLD
jgi:hypothetical protein